MVFNSTSQVIDFSNYSLYNPACYEELRKFGTICTNFRASVMNTFHHKFIIVVFVLAFIIAYTLFVKYREPQYSKSEFYLKYIDRRVDYILAIVTMILIAYIFF